MNDSNDKLSKLIEAIDDCGYVVIEIRQRDKDLRGEQVRIVVEPEDVYAY